LPRESAVPAASSRMMQPLRVTACSVASACGAGVAALSAALREGRSGLRPNDFTEAPLSTFIGRVPGVEDCELPADFAAWECRNNRLAWLALGCDGFREQALAARERYGARRVALVLGTSPRASARRGGVSTAAAGRPLPGGPASPDRAHAALAGRLRARRPRARRHRGDGGHGLLLECQGVRPSRAAAEARHRRRRGGRRRGHAVRQRAVRLQFAGARLAGALPPVRRRAPRHQPRRGRRLRPAGARRRGRSVAARLRRVERRSPHVFASSAGPWRTARDRGGARECRARARSRGLREPARHCEPEERRGRGAGDRRLFPATTRASSTKGWTGHTLGAAGIVEAVIAFIALEEGFAPGTLNASTLDPACGPQVRLATERAQVRVALSNSFGFGGSNCTLLFGRERDA